jgi:hypothetical protein
VEKHGPVLVGIGLVGALAGILIAGHGPSLGIVSAAPGDVPAAIAPTTTMIASEAPVPTTADGPATTATTVVVTAAAPSTSIAVASEAAGPGTTTPATEAPVVADTLDIPPPLGPDPTLDIPAPTTAAPLPAATSDVPPDDGEPDPSEVPWAAGTDRASVRVVIANGDMRPDLDEAMTQRLTDAGYTQITVAADVAPVEYTTIYYRVGFNRAAVAITLDLEAADVSLEPMPDTPVTNADAAGDVVVLLGPDIPT